MEVRARILIVDDDVNFRETLADVLREKDYLVTIATDGFDALHHIQEVSFNAVLMDVRMPGMNGVEAYKALKEDHPKMPVIMITAYAVEDLINEALREGAYGVIHKPLDIEKTIVLLEEAIGLLPSSE